MAVTQKQMFGFLEPRGPVKAKCSRPYTECEPRIGLGPKGNSALRDVVVTKKFGSGILAFVKLLRKLHMRLRSQNISSFTHHIKSFNACMEH